MNENAVDMGADPGCCCHAQVMLGRSTCTKEMQQSTTLRLDRRAPPPSLAQMRRCELRGGLGLGSPPPARGMLFFLTLRLRHSQSASRTPFHRLTAPATRLAGRQSAGAWTVRLGVCSGVAWSCAVELCACHAHSCPIQLVGQLLCMLLQGCPRPAALLCHLPGAHIDEPESDRGDRRSKRHRSSE